MPRGLLSRSTTSTLCCSSMLSIFSRETSPSSRAMSATFSGIVRVDVHADRAVAAGDDERVAVRGEQRAQRVGFGRCLGEHEFRAEAMRLDLLFCGERRTPHRVARERSRVRRAAGQHAQHAFHEIDEALAARVDDFGFFQDGELFGRLLESLVRGVDRRVQHRVEVLFAGGFLEARIGCAARHREDRPLDRLEQRFARGYARLRSARWRTRAS